MSVCNLSEIMWVGEILSGYDSLKCGVLVGLSLFVVAFRLLSFLIFLWDWYFFPEF